MLIDKLLSGAIRLWLQSQVSAVENLEVKIAGKDRQILQGSIPEVFLGATHGIYQGIHLSELAIKGTNIEFNLPQVLKRKPLKLLEPIVVDIKVLLLETDLQNSLSSPLFASGLTALWSRFVIPNSVNHENSDRYQWHDLSLSESGISFRGNYNQSKGDSHLVSLHSDIRLYNNHTLLLSPQEIITIPELPVAATDELLFDLGTQVTITQLEITSEYLMLRGTITVFP